MCPVIAVRRYVLYLIYLIYFTLASQYLHLSWVEAADQILSVLNTFTRRQQAGWLLGGRAAESWAVVRGGGDQVRDCVPVVTSPAPVASGPRHRHHARTRHSSHTGTRPRQMQCSHKVVTSHHNCG